MLPRLTIVVLTLDEERNVGPLLDALARQRDRDFEVIVLDAGSRDRTVEVVRAAQADFPVTLTLEASPHRVPIGAARNRGVELARAPCVAFLSADVRPDEQWTGRALARLRKADMVFGPQLHAPRKWTAAAAVRGLRYHFPRGPVEDALPYASNAAAAYHRDVLLRFPFDPDADAAEDLLLARRAVAAGFRAAYEPRMIVRHHDVATAREELRKSWREGRAWGAHANELGVHGSLVAWWFALLLAVGIVPFRPVLGTALLAAFLWAPALRRAARRRRSMRLVNLAKGVAVSPFYDLVFLVQYLRGLMFPRPKRRSPPRAPPAPTATAPLQESRA